MQASSWISYKTRFTDSIGLYKQNDNVKNHANNVQKLYRKIFVFLEFLLNRCVPICTNYDIVTHSWIGSRNKYSMKSMISISHKRNELVLVWIFWTLFSKNIFWIWSRRDKGVNFIDFMGWKTWGYRQLVFLQRFSCNIFCS